MLYPYRCTCLTTDTLAELFGMTGPFGMRRSSSLTLFRTNNSTSTTGVAAMAGMGVGIRVPSGWEVESKAVDGKKCIGTHNGSCECSVLHLV